MRVLYASKKGGKPMRMGMNQAKRVAHAADTRDQLIVQKQLGPGLPRQRHHHQELVQRRHQYYKDIYDEHIRLDAQVAASAAANLADAGDADRAVPEPAPGSADQ